MSLIILTKSPTVSILSRDFFKSVLVLLFNRVRGPKAVTSSLLRGLEKLQVGYLLNHYSDFKKEDTVFVNENILALRYAINLKKEGKIRRLVVGPNFVIYPNDQEAIMRSTEIDFLLFPCEWIKRYWVSIAPELKDKIVVWPAGVENHGEVLTKNRDLVLIYLKNCPKDLFKSIIFQLEHNKIKFRVIRYGSFKQSKYFKLLEKSKAVIYLSNSETQGIAMLEAWEKDVPTLVWDRGFVEFNGEKFFGTSTSPYLSNETGDFFENEMEFKEKVLNFLNQLNKKTPRKYVLDNLVDEISTKAFLNFINYYEN